MVEGGYEFFAEKQLVTVYSVPSYRDIDVCGGAVMCVDESLVCSFQVILCLYSFQACIMGWRAYNTIDVIAKAAIKPFNIDE